MARLTWKYSRVPAIRQFTLKCVLCVSLGLSVKMNLLLNLGPQHSEHCGFDVK